MFAVEGAALDVTLSHLLFASIVNTLTPQWMMQFSTFPKSYFSLSNATFYVLSLNEAQVCLCTCSLETETIKHTRLAVYGVSRSIVFLL